MTYKEMLERLADLGTSDEREKLLRPVLDNLSQASMIVLKRFQDSVPEGLTFDQFVVLQNRTIVSCVVLECTGLGAIARMLCDLEPITLDDEIPTGEPA